MIPKIIHYVWVGGKPLTPLAKRCIKSWRKNCPDYEIRCWDETNFDINENEYCKEAYENKKWAFVADYIRLKVLYEYGGIYLDTDVEVKKSFDCFLNLKAFTGFEDDDFITTGVLATEKNGKWINDFLETYKDKHFVLMDGKFDMTTNVVALTDSTKKLYPDFKPENKKLDLSDVVIYPNEYFCPLSHKDGCLYCTKNTYAIHHFAGSWVAKPTFATRFKNACKKMLRKVLGTKNYLKLKNKVKGNKND